MISSCSLWSSINFLTSRSHLVLSDLGDIGWLDWQLSMLFYMLKHAEPWIRVSLWPMAAHNVCQARVEEELKKLDAGAKESARLESMSISYQVDDLRRCLAKHVKLFQDIWGKIRREKHDRYDQTFRFERSCHGTNMYQYYLSQRISAYLNVSWSNRHAPRAKRCPSEETMDTSAPGPVLCWKSFCHYQLKSEISTGMLKTWGPGSLGAIFGIKSVLNWSIYIYIYIVFFILCYTWHI